MLTRSVLRELWFLRIAVLVLIVCCALSLSSRCADTGCASATLVAQQNKPAATPKAPATDSRPSLATLHPIAQGASRAGVRQCVEMISKIMTFLTANTQTVGYGFIPQAQADEHLVSFSLEQQTSEADTIYTSATFAPTSNYRCDVVYESIQYMDMTCAAMEKKLMKEGAKESKDFRVLYKYMIVTEAGNVRFFLMPAGSGCIMIKKETLLDR